MFPSYRLEHPGTHEVRVLDGRSYVLAGLFGPFFVLWRTDLRSFASVLLMSTCLALTDLLASLSALFLPGLLMLLGLALVPAVLAVIQSRVMVAAVRRYFVRQGWVVRRAR
jgi:hypothetical protein